LTEGPAQHRNRYFRDVTATAREGNWGPIPIDILIGLAVFAALTIVTDGQTTLLRLQQ